MNNSEYTKIFKKNKTVRILPEKLHEWRERFQARELLIEREAGVFNCKNVLINTNEGLLIKNGEILNTGDRIEKMASEIEKPPSLIKRIFSTKQYKKLKGTSFYLDGFKSNSFFHFFLDVAPKVHLARLANLGEEHWDRIILPRKHEKFHREFLIKAGLQNIPTITTNDSEWFECERLISATAPSIIGHPSRWVINFIIDLFSSKEFLTTIPNKRLYISRRDARRRRVINEVDIETALKTLGFEFLDFGTLTVSEIAREMAQCEIVVGPHGGGNLQSIFQPRNSSLIQLFSPKYLDLGVWASVSHLPLRYRYLFGNGKVQIDGVKDALADFEIDPSRIVNEVEAMLCRERR